MNKILVATDGSESAAEAVEFGIELAAEHEAELILVHVVPVLDIVPASGFGIGGAFPHEPSLEDQRSSSAQRPLRRRTASSRRPCCSQATPWTRSSPTPILTTSI